MAIQARIKDILFNVGDTVRVVQTLQEEGKQRLIPFEGTVISIKGRGINKMFTVRRIGVDGIGIERIFPLYSPTISNIIVKKKGKTRRAKLYYLRKKNKKL